MKRLDKLILSSFIGPFILTFLVVVFILLTQFMLRYFDDIIGKGLSFTIIGELIFYFSINMTTNAFPLAILLSSLMTFGNLGEHFELTAIKGSGISLLRAMQSLFIFAICLTVFGYINNNYIVPKANLRAFSLLYDIKQKKPSLDIRPGTFYGGIPGYSIKINERMSDGETIKKLIIYNHNAGSGNKEITLADSGKMYTILNERYLVFELFNGENIREQAPRNKKRRYAAEMPSSFVRNKFESSKIIFDLEDFNLKRTRQELFKGNRMMKSSYELRSDLDTMGVEMADLTKELEFQSQQYFDEFKPEALYNKFNQELSKEIQAREEVQEKKRQEDLIAQLKSDEEKLKDSIQMVSANKNLNQTEEDSLTQLAIRRLYRKAGADSLLAQRKVVSKEDQKQVVGAPTSGIVREEEDSDTATIGKATPVRTIRKERQKSGTLKVQDKKLNIKKAVTETVADAVKKEKLTSIEDSKGKMPKSNPGAPEQTSKKVKKNKEFSASDVVNFEVLDSVVDARGRNKMVYAQALNKVRFVKNKVQNKREQIYNLQKRINKFEIEKHKKLGQAISILIMFLIGAPLGAIIKRGGLGMPVLLSIAFFIFFYIINISTERWARQSIVSPFMGAWTANFILLPIGLFFLKQARNDARLFEADFYAGFFKRISKWWKALKQAVGVKK